MRFRIASMWFLSYTIEIKIEEKSVSDKNSCFAKKINLSTMYLKNRIENRVTRHKTRNITIMTTIPDNLE